MHASIAAPAARQPASRALGLIAASVFGLAGVVIGSLALGLVLAVRLADEGRVAVAPDDLAVARVLADYAPVIAAVAAAHLVASVAIAVGRPWGRLLGVAAAGAGIVALVWTVVPPIAGFGIGGVLGADAGAGIQIVATLVAVYAGAVAATVASSAERS